MNLVDAFENASWKAWDQVIEEDSHSGRLDFLIDEAIREQRKNSPGSYVYIPTPRFWDCLGDLPESIMYAVSPYSHNMLREKPSNKIGKFWSAKIERNYRALAVTFIGRPAHSVIWVGNHKQYKALLR